MQGLLALVTVLAAAPVSAKESLDKVCAIYGDAMKAHPKSALDAHKAIVAKGEALIAPLRKLAPKAPREDYDRAIDAIAATGWHRAVVGALAPYLLGDPADHEFLWSGLAKDEKVEGWSCPAMKAHDAAVKADRKRDPKLWDSL
jgi:hypothetical protein